MHLPRVTFPGRFTLVTGPTVTQTGTLTSGSAVVTGLSDTSAFAGALGVSGTGIPAGTYVQTVDSSTQITLTQAATASGSVSLTFAIEPVTLAQAKKQCRVTFTTDDDYLALLITAARERCEGEIDRAFLTSTWDYSVERFPLVENDDTLWRFVQNPIIIPKGRVSSVTSVSYVTLDGTTTTLVQGTNYMARTGDPGAVYPYPNTYVWPTPRSQLDAVTVRFVAGYGATADSVPSAVKLAVLMYVAHLYNNREATTNVAMSEVPMGVGNLLASQNWGSRP